MGIVTLNLFREKSENTFLLENTSVLGLLKLKVIKHVTNFTIHKTHFVTLFIF